MGGGGGGGTRMPVTPVSQASVSRRKVLLKSGNARMGAATSLDLSS